MVGPLYVAAVIVFTVYGQLILRWQVGEAGALPHTTSGRVQFLGELLTNPWIWSALAGGALAALCWMLALTRYDLGTAYPFMSTTFGLVLIGSALFFGERVT